TGHEVANLAAGGTIDLSAASPITFAINTSSSGSITANATESAATDDDVSVNAGITVESTGGDVDFNAGDSIRTAPGSVIKSDSGAINLSVGVGDTDGIGAFFLQGTLDAATVNLTSPFDIYLDDLNLGTPGLPASTVSVTSTGGAILDSSDPMDTGDDVDVT